MEKNINIRMTMRGIMLNKTIFLTNCEEPNIISRRKIMRRIHRKLKFEVGREKFLFAHSP